MRTIIIPFFLLLIGFTSASQIKEPELVTKDSLLIIEKNPLKGFYSDYLVFIPAGTPLHKKITLLVEPNNTGQLADDPAVHKKAVVYLASVSSVGNNVATSLKIPLLVPVFPRPVAQPLIYTHALDRDVMLEERPLLKRLDLQLLKMFADAKTVLGSMNIKVDSTFFMNGFSASGTFTNRFSLIHPEIIKALAIGGFNGSLMCPQNEINGRQLNYPLGINDFKKMLNQEFNYQAYKAVPQFIYMGALDSNDAVQFDDAYTIDEREIVNSQLGENVQKRYMKCREIYRANHILSQFKTYETIGHWTTAAIHTDVINFFRQQLQE